MSEKNPTMKPAVLHILLALAEQDRHGYAIMQAVRQRSGGTVNLNTASFYRHLGSALRDGLLAESASRPRDADSRRGVYYRITPAGRAMLRAERARLVDLLATVDDLSWAIDKGRR